MLEQRQASRTHRLILPRWFFSLLLFVGMTTLWSVAQANPPTPQVLVVNPQNNDNITTSLTPAVYVLNGTCFAADSVSINITGPSAYSQTFNATVKGGVWEYMWGLAPGGTALPSGVYTVTVTPNAGTIAGTASPALSVTLTDNTAFPVASLSILPSSVISGFLLGSDAFGGIMIGGSATVGVQVHATPTLSSGMNITNLTLSEPNSTGKSLTPDLINLNNDGVTGTPASFLLNDVTGIAEGITTIGLATTDGTGATSVTYNRSILVDLTEPTIPTVARSYTNTSTAFLFGSVSDPVSTVDPGTSIPSGIGHVIVTIQPPTAANTVVRTADLTYGSSPSSAVGWTVTYPFTENGVYTITVVAIDNAGNKSTSGPTSITIDGSAALTPSITAPVAGAYVGGQAGAGSPINVPVSATIGGSSGTVTWHLQDNGVEFATGSGTTLTNVNWPTSDGDESDHTLTLWAVDSTGLTGRTSIVVHVDNKNPVAVITSPAAAAYVAGTINVTGTVSDKNPNSWMVQYSPHGMNTWTQIGATGSGSSVSVSWATPAGQADYDLRIVATDLAGNTANSATVTVHVDNLVASPPVITAPVAGAYVSGTTVSVTGTISDTYPGTWILKANGTTIGTGTGAAASATWDTTAAADGTYTLILIETNQAGQVQSSAPVIVYVDNLVAGSPPVITAPADGSYVSGTINITGTVKDPYPNTWVVQSSPHGANTWTTIGSSGTGASVGVSWATPAGQADYDLQIVATNQAGLMQTSTTITVHVDNLVASRPVITAPAAGAYVSGTTVSVTGTISDTYPGTWVLKANGTQIGSGAGAAASATWDTTTFPDGNYALILTETNLAGQVQSSIPVVVHVDNLVTGSPPVITTPASGAYVAGTVMITGTIFDPFPNTWVVQSSPHGANTWTTIGSSGTGTTVSVNWATPAGQGDYDLQIVATNQAGLMQTSSTVTVHVDNVVAGTPPVITAPAPGAYVSGTTVSVTGTIFDINPGTWVLKANGTQIGTGAGTAASTTWDTTAVPDGNYALILTETNLAGQVQSSAAVVVHVDNLVAGTPPVITAPASGAYVAGTVMITGTIFDPFPNTWVVQSSPHGANTWTQIGASGTGTTVGVNWATPAGQGDYDLQIVATNQAGLMQTSSTVTVHVDNVVAGAPPVITVPAPGAYVSGTTVSVMGTIFDINPGTWVLKANGTQIGTGAGAAASATWDTTAVPDGNYALILTETNLAGQVQSSVPVVVHVDNLVAGSPPVITAPANGAYVSGTINITGTVKDPFPNTWMVQSSPHGANTWTQIGATGAGASVGVSWVTPAGQADYDLRIVATNQANLTQNSAVITVHVDNVVVGTPPVINTPVNGAYVAGATVSVTGTIFDVSPGTWILKANGTQIGTGAGTAASATWDTTATADGAYTLILIETNQAGQVQTSAPVIVYVDNLVAGSPPVITAPASGAYVSGTINITGTVKDPYPNTWVVQSSPHGANTWTQIGAMGNGASVGVSWITPAGQADYDLQIVATNQAGLIQNSAIVTVHVDNLVGAAPPVINTPVTGAYVSGTTVSVTGTIFDTYPGTWVLKANGAQIGTGAGTAANVTWDTTAVPDGNYALILTETNQSGQVQSSIPVVVHVDNLVAGSPPVITTPANGAYVSGTISITGTIFDPFPKTWVVQSSPHGANTWTQIGATGAGTSVGVSWATPAGQADYDLRIVATNQVNLTQNSAVITVHVDNVVVGTPPVINTPANGAYVAGATVSVTGTIFDVSPGTWVLKANGTQIGTGAGAAPSVTWDTTAVADGDFTLILIETNQAGQVQSSAPVVVHVDNLLAGSPPVINTPAPGAYVAGIVNVTGSISDPYPNTWVLKANGTQIGSGIGSTASVAWDTTAIPDGNYALVLTETNKANLVQTSATVTVHVDNLVAGTPPAINTPAPGAYVSGATVSVTGTIFDANPGTWVLKANGTQIGTGAGSAANVTWDTTAIPDGNYALVLTETNLAGLVQSSAAVVVHVDNLVAGSPPVITTPANGAYVSGTINITGTVKDPYPKTWVVQSSPHGANTWTQIGATGAGTSVGVSWVTPAGQADYDLRIVATNQANLTQNSAVITVHVDNVVVGTPPVINTPANGAYVAGATVSVTGTIFDVSPGTWILKANGTQIGTGTGTAASATWDTTALADGTYTLILVETNQAGQAQSSAPVLVHVDNLVAGSPPVITAPASGAYVSGTINITGTVKDPYPNTWVVQSSPHGANTWTQIGASGAGASVGVSWVTPAGQADYDLRIIATNQANLNQTSAIVTVHVDNLVGASPPVITAPAAGAYVSGATVSVTGTISDAYPNTWVLKANGVTIGTGTGAAASATWDTTALADGNYELILIETNQSGQVQTSVPVVVHVDNLVAGSPPVITAPAPGAYVSGTINVIGTVKDLYPNTWQVQSSPHGLNTWTTIGSGTGASVSVSWATPVVQADYDLQIVAVNKAVLTQNSAIVTVHVDNLLVASPPVITAPAPGAYVSGATVSVIGKIFDVDPGTWVLTANGKQIGAGSGTTANITWDTTTFADGDYALVLTETNLAGQVQSSVPVVVHVDNLVAALPPVITAPANGAYIFGTVTVTGTIPDPYANTWVLKANGTQIGSGTGTSPSVSWTPSPDNDYTLVLTETNHAGLVQSSAPVVVHVDNVVGASPPVITAPAPNAYVAGTVTVTGTISDPYPNTWQVQSSPHSANTWTQIGSTGTGTSISVSWATPDVQAKYDLRIVAVNLAGLTQISAIVTVNVDNLLAVSPPVITFPAPNAYIASTVTVTGTIPDVYPGTWVLTANGTTIGTGTGSTASAAWDTTKVTDGPYTLVLTETNQAGQVQSSVPVPVNVDNPVAATPPVITAPSSGAYISGTVMVTGAISDPYPNTWVLTANGTPIGNGTGNSVSVSWTPVNGDYTLVLTETNKAGKSQSSVPVVVHVDNLGTAPAITAPTPGLYGGPSPKNVLTVKGTISEAHIKSWTVTANGAVIGSGTTATVNFPWTTTPGTETTYSLMLHVTNQAGLSQDSTAVNSVVVDNLAPAISITGPANGASVDLPFNVTGTIVEDHPASAQLQIFDSHKKLVTTKTITPATGAFSVPITNADNLTVNQIYTFIVSAIDSQGNASATSASESNSIGINVVLQPTAALAANPLYDENGTPHFVEAASNPADPQHTDNNNLGQLFSGGAFSFALFSQNATNLLVQDTMTVVNQKPVVITVYNGAPPASNLAIAAIEATHLYKLTASNAKDHADTSTISVAVSKTGPLITVLSPALPPATTTVPPGSTLTLYFTIKDRGLAPLLLNATDGTGSVPQVNVTVTGGAAPYTYNLLNASKGIGSFPGGPVDTALVSGSKSTSYTIIWKIPLDPSKYQVGTTYTISVGGASDIVKNPSNSVTAKFTVGIN